MNDIQDLKATLLSRRKKYLENGVKEEAENVVRKLITAFYKAQDLDPLATVISVTATVRWERLNTDVVYPFIKFYRTTQNLEDKLSKYEFTDKLYSDLNLSYDNFRSRLTDNQCYVVNEKIRLIIEKVCEIALSMGCSKAKSCSDSGDRWIFEVEIKDNNNDSK